MVTVEDLERFPISVILSFLSELEGTSFLLTRKDWAKKLLPIFRLPNQEILTVATAHKNRHKFIVFPVQDASTRLARLNTRRWKKQRIAVEGFSTEEFIAQHVAKEGFDIDPGYPPLLRFADQFRKSLFPTGSTILASYPRSGNTLLRCLLEATTGMVTGSDTRPDRTLSLALAEKHDLVGEGLINPSHTPVVKTHWPERIGYRKFSAHRVVLLVRNPFDAIDSYWNLNVTNTHTKKVVDQVYEDYSHFFQELALNEMKVWLRFLSYWVSQPVPICWLRYEDLIIKPQQEIIRILQFTTCQNDVDWEGRVSQVLLQEGHGYRPSVIENGSPSGDAAESTLNTASRFGGSMKRYSAELLRRMHDMDKSEWLEKLGYHVFDQGFPDNLSDKKYPSFHEPYNGHKSELIDAAVQINNPPEMELRSPSCPYGRNMRVWRRKRTKDDTEPFPTISRS